MSASRDLQTLLKWVTQPETAPESLSAAVANVQAIGTEGSFNNPSVIEDEWVDLDVTVFISQPVNGWDWVVAFGQPVIWQHLQNRDLFGVSSAVWDTWLVRYEGTARIDWKFAPASDVAAYLAADTLNKLVWRRNQPVPAYETSSASHAVLPPTQATFNETLNELLWCAGNVAKGLHRHNLVYANEMMNAQVRPALLQLCAWQATLAHPGFDAGAESKFVAAALSPQQRARLFATYDQGTLNAAASSLRTLITLAVDVATAVAQEARLDLPAYLPGAMKQLDAWL